MNRTTHLAMRRLVATCVAAKHGWNPITYANQRWPGDSPTTVRTAVGGSTSAEWSVAADESILFDVVLESSIIGRLPNLRRVPTNVRLITPNDQARGYWIGQAKPIPMSKVTLLGSALATRKVACIVVVSDDALEARSVQVERVIEADFRRALSVTLDEAFIDPNNAGVAGEMPASVTNGVTPIVGSGNPTADLAALVAAFDGDLTSAAFVTDPVTAAQIALWRDSGGAAPFPDCGPAGGSLLNLPLLTSRASPRDSSGGSLALIDGSGIAASLGGLETGFTNEAMLEMDDTPTGEGFTPTAASATPILLYQLGVTGIKTVLHVNWEAQRACVAVVTGCDYS